MVYVPVSVTIETCSGKTAPFIFNCTSKSSYCTTSKFLFCSIKLNGAGFSKGVLFFKKRKLLSFNTLGAANTTNTNTAKGGSAYRRYFLFLEISMASENGIGLIFSIFWLIPASISAWLPVPCACSRNSSTFNNLS